MTTRRHIRLIGLIACPVVILLSLWTRQPPKPRLIVENYSKVRVSMSRIEAEDLLGGPPGNYGQFADGVGKMTCEGYLAPPGSVEKIWCDDANRFEIYFDGQNRVVGKHRRAGYQQLQQRGFWHWLRLKLGM